MNEQYTSFTGMLPSTDGMLTALPILVGIVLVLLVCFGLFYAGLRKGEHRMASAAMAMSNRQYRRLKRGNR